MDDNTLTTVASLAAVGVALVAFVGGRSASAARPVIDIPAGFGSDDSSDSSTTDPSGPDGFYGDAPAADEDGESTDWQDVEDADPDSGTEGDLWRGTRTGFNPDSRADLIDGNVDGSDNDRPWVGL